MQSGFSIGVDLGGTNLRVAVFNGEFDCLDSLSLRTRLSDGPHAVISDLGDAVDALVSRAEPSGLFRGVGVGTPGPLELPTGIVRQAPNLPGWNGLNVRAAIEQRLGYAIVLECDGNTAALGEYVRGGSFREGENSICMLTLGTGVGSGILLDGEIWHGEHGMGGEAGHITIWPDGHRCGCGNDGCLEQYASATAVRRMAREAALDRADSELAQIIANNRTFDAKDVCDLAKSGNAAAKRIFHHVGEALGMGLSALINTLDLRLYLLGGGMAEAWELFSPIMLEVVERRSYVYRGAKEGESSRMIRIEKASLGAEAGLIGAGALPFQENCSPPDRQGFNTAVSV